MISPCIFCKIIANRQSTGIVYQDELVTAINDLFPRAPVHILVIPNRHIESVNQLTVDDQALVGYLILAAQKLAAKEGLAENGYRLVINTGAHAGQSVHHLHLHLLGGKPMPMMGG
ncbi:MAG TPA: histidine triad nucleotide-binding protein [Leptolinea sp.]